MSSFEVVRDTTVPLVRGAGVSRGGPSGRSVPLGRRVGGLDCAVMLVIAASVDVFVNAIIAAVVSLLVTEVERVTARLGNTLSGGATRVR